MGVGTSKGAFFDDEFQHQAGVPYVPDTKDNNVVTPDKQRTDKALDDAELNPSTGLGIEIAYKGGYGTGMNDNDGHNTSVHVGDPAFTGGGLSGTTPMRNPANDNRSDLYNPREPNMIGSKEMDDALDNSWREMASNYTRTYEIKAEQAKLLEQSMYGGWNDLSKRKFDLLNKELGTLTSSDKDNKALSLEEHFHETVTKPHEEFIKKYDELHEFGEKLSKDKAWTELNTAKYNKLGRQLNENWEDIKPHVNPIPGRGPEEIKSAALMVGGELFENSNHGLALNDYLTKYRGKEIPEHFEEGFTTTHGRFVSREEAFKIAKEKDQIRPEVLPSLDKDSTMLLSEDLK